MIKIDIHDKVKIILDDEDSDEVIESLVPSVWKVIYSPIDYHDNKDITCYIHFNNEKFRDKAIDKLIKECNKEINQFEEMLQLSLDVTNDIEDSAVELWKADIKEYNEYISFLENFRDMFVKEGNVNVSPQRIRVFEVKL